jgi:hypothetical protein
LHRVTVSGQGRARKFFGNNVNRNNPDGSTSKVWARKSEDLVQEMQGFHKQGVLFSSNRMWICILEMFPRNVGVLKE